MAFSQGLLRRLPFSESTTPLQALTYLLGISLFSISFLVFLNSSVSFVITDLIGIKDGVGDIVGTLGFVDEVVALVACPIWGLVSDRSGVRFVAVTGYAIIGLSLFLFVQARNVYPQLLLARIFFAVGATAAATMVTAILPSLTDETGPAAENGRKPPAPSGGRQSVTLSVDSEATITPERFRSTTEGASSPVGDGPSRNPANNGKPSALAGYVGLFTGCGALVALALFLPLPARFGRIEGVTLGDAVKYSFYVVGSVSFLVAIFVFLGLRGLRGEEGKGWRMLLGLHSSTPSSGAASQPSPAAHRILPYWHLLRASIRLGLTDADIALGYLGGFVARASTVAISLFLPLSVNAFFIRNGFCRGQPTDPSPDLKRECRQAYVLASVLTGVAQLSGLLCAPLFGYLSAHAAHRIINWPIVATTTIGLAGYLAFPRLPSPEFRDEQGRGGGPAVLVLAALMGVSQIGAIVCSLGALGRGVLKVEAVGGGGRSARDAEDQETLIEERADGDGDGVVGGETAPLLGVAAAAAAAAVPEDAVSRVRLKGSVAGVYSWCGGAAILLLTKLGGYLFDSWSAGAPFYMMAAFNAVLLFASLGIDLGHSLKRRRESLVY
ncbi:faed767e-9235-4e4e-9c0c-f16c20c57d4b [Thermothielavioides terrestris]|uniref:Faed767e-9235-4e4e-9c0c-f16c20c57d4b n=1 Tax=Thermothielavioides terrestris TaxID=2587410 RepID=A0A446BJN6_9PEZI|nr:faed767e-9235-4e4e-9c0c-f16c20c57d4b [Thermothielavioides terrestris]